jgi:hypothetical protein
MESGPCWAFAAIGMLESVIKIQENCAELNPDLSEQYILSCLPGAGSMMGGSSYLALQYMMETTAQGNYENGAIPEWCFPYQISDKIPCSAKESCWQEQLIPISSVDHWTSYGNSGDRQKIKDDIVEKGPVIATITNIDDFRSWGYEHTSPNDYYPDPGSVPETNHVVLIIGWKDDPSISNGGYWICKNSWEPFWGYDGFFNIEYGALNIDEGDIIWVEYDPSNNLCPDACICENAVGNVGEEITLDASESFDSDGEIVEYSWDFGDGTQGTGETVQHQYTERGIYTVFLTTIDNQGKEDYEKGAALVDMWTENDYWIYDLDEMHIQQTIQGIETEFDITIPDLKLTVSEITDEAYILDIVGDVQGDINIDIEGSPISATFSRFTKIVGRLNLEKTNLCLTDIKLQIKGLVKVSLDGFPLNIPVPFDVTIDPVIDEEFSFISFPLDVNKCWSTGENMVTIDGEISSFYLKLIKTVNTIAKLFGKGFLPEQFEQLLPILDISDLLEEMEIPNSFEVMSHPRSFVCKNFEPITVPAGTFDAFEILGSYESWNTNKDMDITAEYYFAPETAMIVDMSISIGDFASIHAELIESNIDS